MSRAADRAGLLLVATGVLSLVSVRGYLEESAATARDVTVGVAAFLALVLLTSARTPPSWSAPLALLVTGAAHVWGTTLAGGNVLGVIAVLAVAAVACVAVEPGHRLLVVGGFALWTPSLSLLGGAEYLRVEPIVAAAAWAALALLVFAVLDRRAEPAERLRRIGLAILAVAIVSAVFERHTVVASRVLAPDDIVAVLAVVTLAVMALRRTRPRLAFALAAVLALGAYVLVGVALLLGKGYHVDAVTSPHYAAELLLRGANPYVAFDMFDSLSRFDLPHTLATKLEDGSYLRSHNYPAGGFLLVTPFVWAGLADMRWVYLGEMLLMGLLLLARSRGTWRPVLLAFVVGNTVLTRQYVLAGLDPTWALGVAAAWLFVERRWLSPVALGLACASRQPAWFFVPFYLLATWRTAGFREATRRAGVAALAFLLPNLPFIFDAPRAWFDSVFAPLIAPLEPYGVGLVRLGLSGPLPLLPRASYALLALGVLLTLAVLLWRFFRRLPNSPLTFPLVPVFFAWRSLLNYFVFLPLLAVLNDDDLTQREERGHSGPAQGGTA